VNSFSLPTVSHGLVAWGWRNLGENSSTHVVGGAHGTSSSK
jgi:hypothetical protein